MAFNSAVILSFALMLTLRMLTELPRVLRETGWLENDISENILNRALSGVLLAFCALLGIARPTLVFPSWFQQISIILLVFFVLSLTRGVLTFAEIGMPLSGTFVVASRFLFEWVLVLFVLNYIKTVNDLRLLFSFFFKPTLFLFILFGFLQIITSNIVLIQGVERITGPFGSPNTFAGFLHLFIALSFYYYAEKRNLFFWLIIGLQYVLLFATGSIAAFLSHFVFILLVSIKEKWFKLKSFYLLIPFIIPAVIFWGIYQKDYIAKRLSIIFQPGTFQLTPGSSLAWRIQAWENYLSLLGSDISNWLLGLGMGVQRFILLHAYPGNLSYRFEAPGTHNDYLAVLIDFGLIGLLLFSFMIFYLNKMMRKVETSDRKFYYIRLYFYSVLILLFSENYIDQLIMFVFLTVTFAFIRVHYFPSSRLAGFSNL